MKWFVLILVLGQAAYEWIKVVTKNGSTWGMAIDASCWTVGACWLYGTSGLFR